MRLGLVLDVVQKGDKRIYADEAMPFLRFGVERAEIYAINPEDHKYMNGTVRAHHINSDQDLELNPLELNGVYFGNLGQSMEEKDTSLTKTLPELCGLFEKLQQYRSQGLSLINSPETMLNFVSKRYLIKMSQNTDIPFIESEEVESLDHLIELSRRDRLMLVKPLISERSNGTIVLNGKTEEELKAHYDRYCKSKTQELNESLYAKVMAEQGLIAQPYTSDFADKGEVKIGIMGGKITLSRIHTLGESQDDVPIVAWGRKDTIVNIAPYSPTTEETALALRIYDIVNEQFPIHNMRVDLAGGKVSEIEALNPSYSINRFNSKAVEEHHRKIIAGFKN